MRRAIRSGWNTIMAACSGCLARPWAMRMVLAALALLLSAAGAGDLSAAEGP